ncbi:MAG: hypothetical protein JWO82_3106 [Akkermansiaceae bacterium]|nr:hypothetical protein [Akkermansiaceae bacterium]
MNGFALHRPLLYAALLACPGCTPSLPLSGAYFPAWIVCMIAGLLGAMVLRGLLVLLGIDRHVAPRMLAYPCIMLSLTLLTWLIFHSR